MRNPHPRLDVHTTMQLEMFQEFLNPVLDDSNDDPTKQEAIDKENIEAFLPLVIRFCDEFGVIMERVDYKTVRLWMGVIVLSIDLSFLRWENETTDKSGSVHSSKLEPLLYRELFGGKLPPWFFTTFPPFKFEPK